ncbi:PREDICTED: fibrocystin-L [Nanorana parkeri]|uniref:fibrocystin-L n=1 Tax=Nanorana parkeri TaxID=125878 RepID=UPI000854C4E3|nr:PREDICTED: fibrocystin-L [Nanorana parkeri]
MRTPRDIPQPEESGREMSGLCCRTEDQDRSLETCRQQIHSNTITVISSREELELLPTHGWWWVLSGGTMHLAISVLLITIHYTHGQLMVSQIMPYYGSLNGATRITIKGNGFAEANQFNYGDGNDQLGNSVQLVSSTRSIPCDVEKDASHATQITCYTRPMPADSYSVRVSVDGVPVDTANICYGYFQYWWCMFQPHMYYTPVISSISPVSGSPGSMITIVGKIYTDVYGSNTALSSNGKNVRVLRVYAGGMPCELLIPNSDTLYGLQLDSTSSDYGSMVCNATGTYVGHHNISFILDSNYGRSLPSLSTYFVSSLNKIAMFQTYAEITRIFPASGSIQGGTVITISGQYFDETDLPARVLVGGQECRILSLNYTTITCITPPKPSVLPSLFPGNRGMKVERWNGSFTLSNALNFNESSPGYAGTTWFDGAFKSWTTDTSSFIVRFSGFLVPPETDYYTLYIKGNDKYALYFSETGNPADKVKVAYGDYATSSYSQYYTQKSHAFYLQKGKSYYIEAYIQNYNGKSAIDVGLYQRRSSFTDQQTADAVNDIQNLQSQTDTVLEKQIITLQNWNSTQQAVDEVQTITVTIDCVFSCPSMFYKLMYGADETDLLSADASATDIESALNNLQSIQPDTVSVTMQTNDTQNVYTVTFNSQRGDFKLLSYKILDGGNMTVDIEEQTKGVPDMATFTLVWDNVYSKALAANASAADVQSAVLDMISAQCPDKIANRKEGLSVKYFRNYETDFTLSGYYRGYVTSESEPFCGRYSLKNPQILYDSTEVKSTTQMPYGAISLTLYNKLCLSYKGQHIYGISVYFQYEDTNSPGTITTINDQISYNMPQQNSWTYICVDLLELIKPRYSGKNFNLFTIGLVSSQDFFVDVLYIGQMVTTSDVTVPRRRPALSSNGIVISRVDVTGTSSKSVTQHTITITPYNCGYNFPLFAVGFAEDIQLNTDSAIYSASTWTPGTLVKINRTQTASPPVGGTFSIVGYENEVTGLPADIAQYDLKYALESIPEIGQVTVSARSGNCRGYSWQIKFLTATGYQPILQINDSTITGVNAKMYGVKVIDGGLFRQHLLGDLVRTPHKTPQVEVYINGIPSQCVEDCGYTWNVGGTPKINSVSSVWNGDDEVLIIDGTGFSGSTANDNTSVTIGNITCPILNVTAKEIRCLVQKASAGTFPITIYIAEVGLAVSSGDNVTFTHGLSVSSITPSEGSLAGGTPVTILGSGFGGDSAVEVGGIACSIIFVNLTMIQCRTSMGIGGLADVVVFTGGYNRTLQNAFSFTSVSAPNITNISPNISSVLGGTTLTILGFSFSSPSADSTVFIGNSSCVLLEWMPTNITCVLPALPPGIYPVLVQVENWGFAVSSMDDVASIKYILELNSISPQHGSMYGGSHVTLRGSGFSSNPQDNLVQIGSLPCNVSASSSTELTCVIQRPGNVFNVNNQGSNAVYGVGYAWSPSRLDISVGDTVVWNWNSQSLILGIGYRVFSVSDAGNITYDGRTFISGPRVPSGVFSYQFTSPGIVYYSSGYINDGQSLYMQGVINVSPLTDNITAVHVTVGGIKANYVPGKSSLSSSPAADCVTPEPICPQLDDSPSQNLSIWFGFSSCYSPFITSITPTFGTIHDSITIVGSGFSNVTCANQVTIGNYPCRALSANEMSITCKIDPQDSMNIGIAELVSLTVNNYGNAINTISQEMNRRFALLPHIEFITPSNGSVTGLTRITIVGSGFSNNNITIAGLGCSIVSVNYTDIICDTESSYSRTVNVQVTVNAITALCKGSCSFTYSSEITVVASSISPNVVGNTSTVLNISGSGFGEDINDIVVYIGDAAASVLDVNGTEIICSVDPIPAGNYVVNVIVLSKGLAQGSFTVNSPAEAVLLTTSGSVLGGTVLQISGNGFHPFNTTVQVGGAACSILSVTPGSIKCVTPASSAAKIAKVNILIPSASYPSLSYSYSEADTPTVTSVSPSTGPSGTSITVFGTQFGSDATNVAVTIGNATCAITAMSDTSLNCTVANHWGGTFPLSLHNEKGFARSSATFTYELSMTSISPNEGSFGGGLMLTIAGSGFDETLSKVLVCNSDCKIDGERSNASVLLCEVPMRNDTNISSQICNVVVINGNNAVWINNSFNYTTALTPFIYDVTPKRGGTAGGTRLTITGSKFGNDASQITVTIAQAQCNVTSVNDTQIVCITTAQSPSQKAKVRVNIKGQGVAKMDNADFFYIDVWSSKYTWGGETPPDEGSLAVITQGQTILLDQSTPVLKMLLIQGGTLIFDEADIELQAENILITDGGLLQIGTEAAPFQHKAIITLHGHLRSPELPVYGAKTLAVRQGTLDLHGIPVPVTWTRLAQTVEAGSSTLVLQQSVTWKAGDEIVIASTGHRHSQNQNEKRTIQSVSADGKNLTLSEPLVYKHLGISVTLPDGTVFEARAEVGLLTRNILVRGSTNVEWSDKIAACPDGFDTGEFATQTCFQGRFGEEIGSDQFGGCIMFHATKPGQLLSIGRIEYVEVFHAGQAFRLGRYPIHWHLMGDMQYKSYVRGCGIHQTYNRAVTIHNTHHLLVEKNVIYDIMGGAFFIEDGIEHGNVLQYNLAVFVRQSTSLLNDDVTPAAFWVTNPNNTIRHNAAAGGTHFGFWYRMHDNPDGPSYDPNICQKRVPLGEFYNNTVHSQGWFGIWIFEEYFPMVKGSCSSSTPSPAIFKSLTTWNCQKGAEWVNGGALQFHNFTMVNNEDSGIETKRVISSYVGGWGETSGAVLKNAIIVGHLDELGLGSSYCTARGITLPFDEGLTVSSVKFMNFDRPNCAAIAVTTVVGLCGDRCGGWSAKFNGIQYFNAPNKAGFRWEHEVVLIDMDGTLTGKTGAKVVPASGLLDPSECSQSSEWSVGFSGYICNSTVSFHRLAFNNPSPSSLLGKDVIISNSFGVSVVPFLPKRLTHKPGWMALLPNANSFNWYFSQVDFISNISYTSTFYGFKVKGYVTISHNLTQAPDMFNIIDVRDRSTQPLSYNNNSNGDWYFNDNTTTLTYLVSGKRKVSRRAVAGILDTTMSNTNVNLVVYQCYFKNCIPPSPPPPPTKATVTPALHDLWSNNSFWQSSVENNYTVPKEGSTVIIPAGKWVITDVDIPPLNKLIIYGVLELKNLTDNSTGTFKTTVLSAIYISIQGGRLVAGTQTDPFQGELHIVLRGNHLTPEFPLPDGPNQGSKVLGVFGELDLHGLPPSVYRTKLASTAPAGSQYINLAEPVDWKVGEDILITTTSYSAWQTETRRIIAVSPDQRNLTLNVSLTFNHTANTYQVPSTTRNYTLAADVALLTRNIKIIGEDYPGWYTESFGARVLVSTFLANGMEYRGSARIENVEFYHSGQEGYPDPIDPRYSLAFLNLGEVSSNESYVKGCAFHNGFSPAIGVFYTNGLDVHDNVIHFTVGEGIRVMGERVNVRGNLVALAVWPGTYQDREEVNNILWHAGIEIHEGTDVVLQNNVVAGFERAGYRINGEPCSGFSNPNPKWYNNEAHGGLYGIFMNEDGLPVCSHVRGFILWKCWDYGIYIQTTSSVQISEVLLADNGMGILPIIYTPASVSHEISNKTVQISKSLLVGSSPNFDCTAILTNNDANVKLSAAHRSRRPPTGGRSGICWPTFASAHNMAPGHPNAGLMSYNAISGLMTVEDTIFVSYKSVCSGESNVMFITNPENEDLQHPIEVSRLTLVDSAENQKVYIHRPDVSKANPSDCVDMDCDAKKKSLLKDLDGSFLGKIGAVVPQSEYQWDGDKSHGLGDYRIPKVMLTRLNGGRIPVSEVAPYKGIIRDGTCVYMAAWESYKCFGLNYEMLVIESLDVDTETRRLSPVAVLGDGYIDLINGPQDHGWCSGYTCQKRVSLFHSIVATNKSFDIYFTSTSPQKMRLKLLNTDDTNSLLVGIYFSNPQRLDVYLNSTYIYPTNIEWKGSDFTLKGPTYKGQYMPQLNSSVYGANFFDSDYKMLYILVRGSTAVEIRTSPLIVVAFNLPAMTVDQFYGQNLVRNLALFLKIPANKIRITKIVQEGSRRRKRATGGLSVSVEISDPPAVQTNTTSNSTDNLSYSDFQSMSKNLASAAINGSLSSYLNVTVSSLSVSDPVPSPSDAGWSQVASQPVDNRTQASSTGNYLATVSTLKVIFEPVAGLPGQKLLQQPSIMAQDSNGNCVSVSSSSMSLTATLKYANNTYVSSGLDGNTTILFNSCWANYTDLVLKLPGSGYKLEFILNNVYAQTRAFDAKNLPSTTTVPPKPDSAVSIYSPFQTLLVLTVTLITINLFMGNL